MDTELYMRFAQYSLIVAHFAISVSRWYLLFFKIKSSSALRNSKWRNIISPRYEESNWFLRHTQTFGSWEWIKCPLFFYTITVIVAGSLSWYLTYRSLTSDYTLMYWISNGWWISFDYILSMALMFLILKRIPIL